MITPLLTRLTTLHRKFPAPLQRALRAVYRGGQEAIDSALDLTETLRPSNERMPPREIRQTSRLDFNRFGQTYFDQLKYLGGLEPHERVLDVGCGAGRIALPLTQYLHSQGRYEGLDVSLERISWCRSAISQTYPHFNFQQLDFYNGMYNPTGKVVNEIAFPYESNSFSFVFLISVFTHMLPVDVKRYLSEISRVLAPGGRCFITYFLLNESSLELLAQNRASFRLPYAEKDYRMSDRANPETAVAYHESSVREWYRECGLVIRESRYGWWSGRGDYLAHQDIFMAEKPAR